MSGIGDEFSSCYATTMLGRLGRLIAVITFYLVAKWLCRLAFEGVSWAADDAIAHWADTAIARRFNIPASTATSVFRFVIDWGPLAALLAIEPYVRHKLESAEEPPSRQ